MKKQLQWCWFTGKTATLKGKIIAKRQAEVLKVEDCTEDCHQKHTQMCLIGKELEGKWL